MALDNEFNLLPFWRDAVRFGGEGVPMELISVILAATADGKDSKCRLKEVRLDVLIQFVCAQQDVLCGVRVAVCSVEDD